MQVSKEKAKKISLEGVTIFEYLNLENSPGVGFCREEVSKKYGPVINHQSKMIYCITDGNPLFVVANKKYQLKPNDLIVIEKGTKYYSEGSYKGFTISIPAFDVSKVEFLK